MQVVRQMIRLYVSTENLPATIMFYEDAQDVQCERQFHIAAANVDVAIVGGVLILAGRDEVLAPMRETQAVFIVDSLSEFSEWLVKNGGVVVHDIRPSPGGRHFTGRHPDGLVVEYYEADA